MKILKAVLALCISVAAFLGTQAAPSSDGVYVGTLGSSPIVLRLETFSADDVSATYYYRRIGRNIELNGLSRANGTFKLTEVTLPERNDLARLELTLRGAALSGTWAELKGKQRVYNVNLRKAGSSDFAALKLPSTPAFKQWISENPLDALRFDMPMKATKLETVAGKPVQWLMEPKSKTIFPSLPKASAVVNDALNLERYRIASVQLQCVLDDSTYSPNIALYSSRLFSITASTAYDCGGAHPDGGQANYTLDLKTAKPLELEDLYRFTSVKIDLDPNSGGFTKYIEARAKVLQGLILAQYGSMTKGVHAQCEEVYAPENNLSFLSWYLTAKGLVVESSLPHVAAFCENSYELPYGGLTKYLAPGSPLK